MRIHFNSLNQKISVKVLRNNGETLYFMFNIVVISPEKPEKERLTNFEIKKNVLKNVR